MPSPETTVGSRTAQDRTGPRVAGPRAGDAYEVARAPRELPGPARRLTVPAGRVEASGTDAELRALTLLTNRTSTRTSATGGPAIPLRDGVRVYLEGLPNGSAGAYAQVVAELAEAEVAVLRVAAAPDADAVDRVLDIAATVPTIVVLRLDGPDPVPEFADQCAALLADRGAGDQTVLDVVFGRHAPLGRLPFDLPAVDGPGYDAGFGLSF
ncbi:hypothetical protein [Yinghuangia seranimata]|uniref:hypothetical protein n=1 Tax=Yinghuangia seranimata TaxID=408067 RepID=UPI00248CC091|nr:hypothetical protein [Yinghuangia seranimata]MDI2128286.1 hypothetical protein [Yinghuangia seranimata]